jgi:hypothetical protein
MRCILIFCLMLAVKTAPADAQSVSPDPQVQTMLTEIHELRQDLRIIAATIQRVQIVMCRHQTQASTARESRAGEVSFGQMKEKRAEHLRGRSGATVAPKFLRTSCQIVAQQILRKGSA